MATRKKSSAPKSTVKQAATRAAGMPADAIQRFVATLATHRAFAREVDLPGA
jgi:hypothetical protein